VFWPCGHCSSNEKERDEKLERDFSDGESERYGCIKCRENTHLLFEFFRTLFGKNCHSSREHH
jgi:hypothetical protein